MIALVNGRPKLINLKEALVHYLEHQKTVVRRRTEYNLRKAKDRAQARLFRRAFAFSYSAHRARRVTRHLEMTPLPAEPVEGREPLVCLPCAAQ